MSFKPTTVADLGAFSALIDARSPSEYRADHVPGAVNCPVLDDDERRIVGTTYVQVSAFEARKIGGAMVARNIASHLDRLFRDKPRDWRPLVYCWRGGLRSGSFVTWLRMVGWDAQQLQGGYKSWRAHVIALIADRAPRLQVRLLCGPTGSAKTSVLHALARLGEQVLDLEELAAHRGSVLGEMPGRPQPTQKGFETLLAQHLAGFDLSRTVWMEAESRRIGRITIPEPLLQRMRAGAVVEIQASHEARLAYLLADYAWLGDDRARLQERLGMLREVLPKELLAQWQAWAREGMLPLLFADLMRRHYDPMYRRSQARDLRALTSAIAVAADSLSPEGIEQLARRILGAVAGAGPAAGYLGSAGNDG
jgi:tRNA 2-selenouridine synthase